MKKKVLTVAFVVALIAIMVSGTLAYFTDNDEVTNTFTIGSVKIEIFENDKPTDDDTVEFDKPFVPIVNTADPSQDASYIPKAVKVQNTGNNNAYIRTHIAIPKALIGYLYLDLDTNSGWVRKQPDTTATVDGVLYDVFTYDYDTAVAPNAFTNELLKGVYLGSNVDLEENSNGDLVFVLRKDDGTTQTSSFIAHTKNADGTYTTNEVNVLVASQAIQTAGFEGVTVTEALNSGFTAHPWPMN